MGSPTLPGGSEDGDRTHQPVPYRTPVWVYTPPPPQNAWQRWGRNLVLYLLTAVSIFLVGSSEVVIVEGGTLVLFSASSGLRLMFGILSILTAHEMGHYLASRYYRIDATLPFFIPFPSLVGTLGAFIRIRGPIPHRRALFDIGVAGPLAGFVVCLPVLWLGIQEARILPFDPDAGGYLLGDPLLFQWATLLVHGPVPADMTVTIGPLGLAGWFGLFVTALNLIPVGQLDGGHVTYALLLRQAHRVSRVAWWACVGLIYFGPNWIIWAILLRVLGRRHPPTLNDRLPVGRGRRLVGILSLAIFVVCFVPNPIIVSWPEILEAIGLGSLIGR